MKNEDPFLTVFFAAISFMAFVWAFGLHLSNKLVKSFRHILYSRWNIGQRKAGRLLSLPEERIKEELREDFLSDDDKKEILRHRKNYRWELRLCVEPADKGIVCAVMVWALVILLRILDVPVPIRLVTVVLYTCTFLLLLTCAIDCVWCLPVKKKKALFGALLAPRSRKLQNVHRFTVEKLLIICNLLRKRLPRHEKFFNMLTEYLRRRF